MPDEGQDTPPTGVLELALAYLRANISVIPILPDGSKAPAVQWKPYQSNRATEEEAIAWWSPNCRATNGVAIIGGVISLHVEILDFDYEEDYLAWAAIVEIESPGLAARLTVIRSASNDRGRHVYLFSDLSWVVPGNLKLAFRNKRATDPEGAPDKIAIAETRGEGGYVLAPGCSAACHLDGGIYEHVSGPTIASRQSVVDVFERQILHEAARRLDSYVATERDPVPASSSSSGESTPVGERPGDIFNAQAKWDDVIVPHGWSVEFVRNGVTYWRRPGKPKGVSATTGKCRTELRGDLLKVFSSNAAPLEADACYSKFEAYAKLNCGGDWREATRRLVDLGYAKPDSPELAALIAQFATAVEKVKSVIEIGEPPVFRKSNAFCDNMPEFKKVWNRKGDHESDPQWRTDAKLLYYANTCMQWTDPTFAEECVRMLCEHRLKKESTYQGHEDWRSKPMEFYGDSVNARYVATKLAWHRSNNHAQIETACRGMEVENIVSCGNDDVLDQIRSQTNIWDFNRIKQRGTYRAQYFMVMKNGDEVHLGSARTMLTQSSFAEPIYDAIKVTVPQLKKTQWLVIADLMAKVTDVELIEDDSRGAEMGEWIRDYISGSESPDGSILKRDRDEALRGRFPYIRDGKLHLHVESLRKHLAMHFSNGITTRDIRCMLKEIGFEGGRITVIDEVGPVGRYYWSGPIPPEYKIHIS